MTILECILLMIVILAGAPSLAFLCAKWGIVGYLRGKEVSEKQNESNSVQNNNEENLKG